MSTDTGSPVYVSMYDWVEKILRDARYAVIDEAPVITNRIERDVLAMRAREAARLLGALADRLELFDA